MCFSIETLIYKNYSIKNMNKRGHQFFIMALMLFAVLLIGMTVLLKPGSPTANVINGLSESIELNDFNVVYSKDGKVSVDFAAKASSNIDSGLTSTLKIRIDSHSGFSEYDAKLLFDGAFAKITSLSGKDNYGPFAILNPEGTLVLTNSINNEATILGRFSFESPEFRGGPIAPENIAVSLQLITYNKIYQSAVIIPFSYKHTSGKYYTANDGKIVIDA